MTSKCIALIVAAGLLTACGTTKTSTTTDVSGAAPQERVVVRGAIVPDDPEIAAAPVAARVKKTASVGGVRPSRPVLADGSASGGTSTTTTTPATPPPASSDSTGAGAPLVAPGSSGGSGGSGTPTSGTPGGSGTETGATPGAGDVTTEALAPIEPATVSAEPAAAPPRPTSSFSLFGFDVREMMNTSIAGFPLWMIVLVAILLAAALVFGTGGRKRSREEYREEPPARDDRRYEDDGEPQPA